MRQGTAGAMDGPTTEAYFREQIQAAWADFMQAAVHLHERGGEVRYTAAFKRYCRLLHRSSVYATEGRFIADEENPRSSKD